MSRALHAARWAFIVVVLAACSRPPALATPGAPGDAGAATKQLVISALSAVGVPASDTTKPYRPSETPSLTGAARSLVQAQLANDPDHGFVVIYSLGSATTAEKVAYAQAAYVASGTGGIQFPPGSHFVIRLVDTTMIFFTWSPGTSPDLQQQKIEDALNGLGVAVPISR
jgi:hypothetical protein